MDQSEESRRVQAIYNTWNLFLAYKLLATSNLAILIKQWDREGLAIIDYQ